MGVLNFIQKLTGKRVRIDGDIAAHAARAFRYQGEEAAAATAIAAQNARNSGKNVEVSSNATDLFTER